MADTDPKVLVTDRRDTASLEGVAVTTPTGYPDFRVTLMTVGARIGVRALRTFLQAFLASLSLGLAGPLITGISDTLPKGATWGTLAAAVLVGLLAALIAACQLTLELSQQWDVNFPERLG